MRKLLITTASASLLAISPAFAQEDGDDNEGGIPGIDPVEEGFEGSFSSDGDDSDGDDDDDDDDDDDLLDDQDIVDEAMNGEEDDDSDGFDPGTPSGDTPDSEVPVPAAAVLFGSALAGIAARRRARKNK